jgi:hypothetical protein
VQADWPSGGNRSAPLGVVQYVRPAGDVQMAVSRRPTAVTPAGDEGIDPLMMPTSSDAFEYARGSDESWRLGYQL